MILMNLIKFFIVFQYFTNIEAKESNIKDRLYWCSSIDPKVTPFLDINSECNKDHNNLYPTNDELGLTAVMSKNAFEVLVKGYECFKEVLQLRTYVNFLGVKYRRLTHYAVNMGNEECRDMVIDHNCGATRNDEMRGRGMLF